MVNLKAIVVFLTASVFVSAHPMGNFSISHYTRLEPGKRGVQVTYILDFAEIPTLELLQQWGIPADHRDDETPAIRKKARGEASAWLRNLKILLNGQPAQLQLSDVNTTLTDGAGGMTVMRVEMTSSLAAAGGGELTVEDANYPNRTGWKEIVVRAGDGVWAVHSSTASNDLSHGLTQYPTDPGIVPPQDVSATVSWQVPAIASEAPSAGKSTVKAPAPVITTDATRGVRGVMSASAVAPPPAGIQKQVVAAATTGAPVGPGSFGARQPSARGSVVAGDYLSRMLHNRDFGFGTILLGLLAAFTLGAFHALSPGHGKTIVAAYLVGSRGTLKHAAFLGFMVTFTHTVSVFLLGLGVLFFQQYVVPDRVIPVLGVISGLSIVVIGGWLLYQRAKALASVHDHHNHNHHEHQHHSHGHAPAHAGGHQHGLEHAHAHAHGHSHQHAPVTARLAQSGATALLTHDDHHHDHGHSHDHPHPHVHGKHDHGHDHPHHHEPGFVHTHTHDGITHSHSIPDSKITFGSLVALGASGGLVPCPSALILMLSAIALGHAALGLALLTSFSLGLALVLMAVGGLVLFAKNRIPGSGATRNHPLFRLIPVFSAVVVMILGFLMTLSAAGLLKPLRFLA